MKIEYDVPVDRIDYNNTNEYTKAFKDFMETDNENMLIDFDSDIKEATYCHNRLATYISRNNLYGQFRATRRKAKVYVLREGKA